MPALSIVISVLVIGIFSAFILYDVQRIVNGGETNYITATLSIYLDVYNIFTTLLRLLGIWAAAATKRSRVVKKPTCGSAFLSPDREPGQVSYCRRPLADIASADACLH